MNKSFEILEKLPITTNIQKDLRTQMQAKTHVQADQCIILIIPCLKIHIYFKVRNL